MNRKPINTKYVMLLWIWLPIFLLLLNMTSLSSSFIFAMMLPCLGLAIVLGILAILQYRQQK